VLESGGNIHVGAGGTYKFAPNNGLNLLISPVLNLVCDKGVVQAEGNILVHELGHMIDIGGVRQLDPSFITSLSTVFSSVRAAGKWNNTYAATNKEEYFAETVTIWYGTNWIDPEGGDGFTNDIGD
jgi:hypothetical protein